MCPFVSSRRWEGRSLTGRPRRGNIKRWDTEKRGKIFSNHSCFKICSYRSGESPWTRLSKQVSRGQRLPNRASMSLRRILRYSERGMETMDKDVPSHWFEPIILPPDWAASDENPTTSSWTTGTPRAANLTSDEGKISMKLCPCISNCVLFMMATSWWYSSSRGVSRNCSH